LPEVLDGYSDDHPRVLPDVLRSALMPGSELLRLQHTILFHCPYCQRVASVIDTTRSRDANTGDGDERLAA
jgi:hypothetical protein